ncbi:hypothetical protein COU15_00265 [Candidatus Kaiserbacteria bacterium CG10_big_fil_rev_8_21_14_0_10_45_20]|uniref:Uncharacterized protein n=1 Tax=Candidatus Kaiserbacteria bacterium CG10_big_fil_rev_8_21_14_0_10_45_20 TaxID=1974607 RepID=A0A2H0UIJ2_9BACT|nr:MAG: hypothetical protein COU15_00265 [Candidatus Kaiserbacteria bacterium CG10_big_fil_rev_8_21_14_0_10_45_20]
MEDIQTDLGGNLDSVLNFFIHFGSEFLAFIVLTAIVVAFTFYFGRERIAPLIAGLYIAIPLYQIFPYEEGILTTPLLQISFYLLIVVLTMVAFSGLSSVFPTSGGGLIGLVILSAITAGMVIAIAIHILPVESLYTFSGATKALFESSQAFFLWMVAPIVGVFFFSR